MPGGHADDASTSDGTAISLAHRFRRTCLAMLRGESGQTLIVAALCMVVLIGFLGLAIDVGQLRYHKRQLQMAADAAALAGALELSTCGSSSDCSAMQTAAQSALTENGFTGSTLLTNCASASGGGLQLIVNNPPCALSSDPNLGKNGYVEAVVSQPQSTVFARVLGITSVPVMARSEASATNSNCIYALDPSGSGAITVEAFSVLTGSCGIVDESRSSKALVCTIAGIQVTRISVVGGVSKGLCIMSPTAGTGATVPSPSDPLSSLATPSVPSCGSSSSSPRHGYSSTLTISDTETLYPDRAYCGGIVIKNGAHVTFMPGTYVLSSKNGSGGLTIDVGSTVTGTGVTFYNLGPNGSISFNYTSFSNGGVDLVAPTSGTYSGILFFQDPQDTAQATIIGSSAWNTVLEGAYYLPTAKVEFSFSGAVHYNILVAYDIEFTTLSFGSTTTNSVFKNDYSSLANGPPLSVASSAVIQ